MGKAPNSLPQVNFRSEGVKIYASVKSGSGGEWGKDNGLEGGHSLRLKRKKKKENNQEIRGEKKHPYIPNTSPPG